ncbi:Extended synaptotagmin-3 [Sparganum proliferum]
MRQKRALISGALKAIGFNEKQSIFDNIGAHELPSWVYFPDVERAEWLNKVIHRMWPFISDYVNDILLKTVQPAPPRIGGVKVYTEESIRRDEIVMDVDLMFYSDARIKVSVGKIIAGVKDFELRGTLRVLMKPLVPKIPFAGAVTYVNFILTHAGNVLSLPGLQQTLNRTVQDAVSSLCVLPNRISVSLVDDVSMAHLKFPSAQGVLRINVISASDLVASDINIVGKNSSDPYCVVRVGAQKFVTAVKKSTINPNWNECFEAVIEQKFGPSLQLEVWDEDKGSKDDELGWASIPIDSIYQQGLIDTAVTLEGVKRGKVHLKLTWLDLSTIPSDVDAAKNESANSPALKSSSTAYLFVRVEQAKNLSRVKFVQEPSPYCILQLGNTVQNTCVKERTQNPLWESIHHFLLSNPGLEKLNIEIRDSRTEFLLGTCSIPLKHLMAESDMTVTRPYTLKATTNEGAVLHLHLELRMLVPGRDRRGDSKSRSKSGSPTLGQISSPNAPDTTSGRDDQMAPDSDDMLVRQRTVDPRQLLIPTLFVPQLSTLAPTTAFIGRLPGL